MAPLHLCVRYCRTIQSRAQQQLGRSLGWVTSQGNTAGMLTAQPPNHLWITFRASDPSMTGWMTPPCQQQEEKKQKQKKLPHSRVSFQHPQTAAPFWSSFIKKGSINNWTCLFFLLIIYPTQIILWVINCHVNTGFNYLNPTGHSHRKRYKVCFKSLSAALWTWTLMKWRLTAESGSNETTRETKS